jgi:hypothetical protein
MRLLAFATLIIAALTCSPLTAGAQTSKEYARMAELTWMAFECSSLSSMAGNEKEERRLFELAFTQGKRFLSAFEAGKVAHADLRSTVPMGFLLVIAGPSADFILGRVFEGAQQNALKGIITTDGQLHSKEHQVTLAQNRFRERNCTFLGRPG